MVGAGQQRLDKVVEVLAVMGSDLYVGGAFTQTADGTVTNLSYIARYSCDGKWSTLANNGLDYYVYALAVSGSDLYVGGRFTQTGDETVPNLNNIARLGAVVTLGHSVYLPLVIKK
jgi:hypothetical protein